jgi:hypothetical protein
MRAQSRLRSIPAIASSQRANDLERQEKSFEQNMEFRDHELDTKFATAAFSELSADEAKRLQTVASSEWIIDPLEKRGELSGDSQTQLRRTS